MEPPSMSSAITYNMWLLRWLTGTTGRTRLLDIAVKPSECWQFMIGADVCAPPAGMPGLELDGLVE